MIETIKTIFCIIFKREHYFVGKKEIESAEVFANDGSYYLGNIKKMTVAELLKFYTEQSIGNSIRYKSLWQKEIHGISERHSALREVDDLQDTISTLRCLLDEAKLNIAREMIRKEDDYTDVPNDIRDYISSVFEEKP